MSELEAIPTPFHPLRAPTLPCELISKIAGYCTGISKFKMLLSMCLVSRHWYNATRRYLFKSIPICTEQRFSEFLALLEANPFIGGWVQEIRFQAGSRCGHNKSLDLEFFYTCPGKLIGKLPAVKKLTFLTFGRHLHPVKSAKALKDCAAAFPRLRILEFWEFYFGSMKDLANFVCGFQELSSLTLSHCIVASGKEEEDTQEGVREDKNQDIEKLEGDLECPPNLRSLRINTGIEEIHTMAPLLWGLCTSSFIKNLQKFAVFFWSIYRPNNSVYMRAVGALLKILGPSLHILDIGTGKLNRGSDLPYLDLSHNTNLRRISFTNSLLKNTSPVLKTLPVSSTTPDGKHFRPCDIHICMSTYVMPEIFHDEPEQVLQFMNRELPDRFQVTKVIPQTDMKRAVGLIGEVHRHLACAGFSTRTVTVKKGYRLKLPYGSKGPSHRIFLWQTLNKQEIPQKESA